MMTDLKAASGRALTLLCIAGCFGGHPEGAANDSVATNAGAHTALDTADCAFVAVRVHPDPDSLLQEFVRRDGAGEFRGASEWFTSAVDCPGHEPGPDVASAARLHDVRVIIRTSDSVTAEVRWDRAGYVSASGFEVNPGLEVDTLTAVRTPFGWRIRSPALSPHVPPSSPLGQSEVSRLSNRDDG